MKSKKGFTLVEVIAVIVILITISLIATPAVIKLLNRNRDVSLDAKMKIILKQAKQYARDNEDFLFESKKKYFGKVCNSVTVKELLEAGYLKEIADNGGDSAHITNPKTKEYIDNESIVVYINSGEPNDEHKKYVGAFVSVYKPGLWCSEESPHVTFSYTGAQQTYTPEIAGYYMLEVWGAQGGTNSNNGVGGKGGYSSGVVYLDTTDTLYIYVGGSGTTGGLAGGFNGGGPGINYNGGGGATDIRVEGNTLYHRIIVAGGGGSGSRGSSLDGGNGGAGGGLDGIPCANCGVYGGGSQTGPGSSGAGFGYGEPARDVNSCGGIDGSGGGGWYGGSAGSHSILCLGDQAGSGGSGFAYDGTNTVPEGYSVLNHTLASTVVLSGNSNLIPSYDGLDHITGNEGDGFAKITFVSAE